MKKYNNGLHKLDVKNFKQIFQKLNTRVVKNNAKFDLSTLIVEEAKYFYDHLAIQNFTLKYLTIKLEEIYTDLACILGDSLICQNVYISYDDKKNLKKTFDSLVDKFQEILRFGVDDEGNDHNQNNHRLVILQYYIHWRLNECWEIFRNHVVVNNYISMHRVLVNLCMDYLNDPEEYYLTIYRKEDESHGAMLRPLYAQPSMSELWQAKMNNQQKMIAEKMNKRRIQINQRAEKRIKIRNLY